MVPAHPQPPGCCRGPVQVFSCRCVGKRWIQTEMCQSDSNTAVAPRCCGLGTFKHAQVTPVLLLLVKEGVFKGERLLCQLLVPRTPGCACQAGQGPADAGRAMGKAAHPLRRVATGPVGLSVPMCGALIQQISKLRSDTNVTLISCLAGERQQWSDGARAARKQVVDVVHRRR